MGTLTSVPSQGLNGTLYSGDREVGTCRGIAELQGYLIASRTPYIGLMLQVQKIQLIADLSVSVGRDVLAAEPLRLVVTNPNPRHPSPCHEFTGVHLESVRHSAVNGYTRLLEDVVLLAREGHPVFGSEPQSPDADRLAALIREVDGRHNLGAAELAERLVARGVRVQPASPAPLVRQLLDWALSIARYERRTHEQIRDTPPEQGIPIIKARFEADWRLLQLTVEEVEAALASLPE